MPTKLVLAAAMAVAALPFAASANPFASETMSVAVQDLDLSTAQGQRTLNARLHRAASDVCGRSISHLGAEMVKKANTCRAEVISEARARLAAMGHGVRLASAD